MYSKAQSLAVILIGINYLASCGSNSTENNGPITVVPSQQSDIYSDSQVSNFMFDGSAPVIELNGPHIVFLKLEQEYKEFGAIATDPQEGDLTANIRIDGTWNKFVLGNYFIRYRVTNSSGKNAIEKVRIVRVMQDLPTRMNVGATYSKA